jgi:pyruvate,orthophosphate dikinase
MYIHSPTRHQAGKIKLGICGEHGGNPDKFCHKPGLYYVSCSLRRVPVARLAAAQVVLENQS